MKDNFFGLGFQIFVSDESGGLLSLIGPLHMYLDPNR